jgi:hypothetical protein
MADDGIIGDTFRSNSGSIVINGKSTTYTKPAYVEPVRTAHVTSSSSSFPNRPLKKLKGKKTGGAASFFGKAKSSSKPSLKPTASSKSSSKSSTSNNLGFKTKNEKLNDVKVVAAPAPAAASSIHGLVDAFEGDEELDIDIDAIPSNSANQKHNVPTSLSPSNNSSSSSSSSSAADSSAPVISAGTTNQKVKKYKKVIKIRYEEETVEDDQGYFVTRRKEIKEEVEVTDDEGEETTRKRAPPTSNSNGNNKKQKTKKKKQGGLMGFFKKK